MDKGITFGSLLRKEMKFNYLKLHHEIKIVKIHLLVEIQQFKLFIFARRFSSITLNLNQSNKIREYFITRGRIF